MASSRSYPTRIINLSLGGALLDFGGAILDPAIGVGERLSLEIRHRGSMGSLRVDGKAVLWNRTSAKTPLLAVQFDEVTGENAEILEDLMLDALSSLHERQVLGRR
jgi:PilZ domain